MELTCQRGNVGESEKDLTSKLIKNSKQTAGDLKQSCHVTFFVYVFVNTTTHIYIACAN